MTVQSMMEKAVGDFREKPLDQRRADLRAIFKLYDLQDLKGAEFRRLLSLARDEGLLTGLLRDIGFQYPQGDCAGPATSDRPQEPENQAIRSL